MGKSRNKGRSEIEFLRGQVRQLKKELKYLRKREHLFEETIEEEIDEVQEVKVNPCPECRGIVIEYDFVHGVLRKCDQCGFKTFKKKK